MFDGVSGDKFLNSREYVIQVPLSLDQTVVDAFPGTVVGDVYKPTERGTAYGWFLSGTLIGPALGPSVHSTIYSEKNGMLIIGLGLLAALL